MKLFAAMLLSIVGATAEPATARERMADFDTISADGDTIEVTSPTWMDGKVRIGAEVVGTVKRRALGSSSEISLAGVEFGDKERHGRWSFHLRTSIVSGALTGDCLYDRTERRLSLGRLTVSQPKKPLLLRCWFNRDGADVGVLELNAAPRLRALVQPARRIGIVQIGPERLEIASVHRLAGSPVLVDMPTGYTFSIGNDVVGAIELTGAKRRRAALPRNAARRDAALVAAMTLALFWDPGDTDD